MTIEFADHLKRRLRLRKIPEEWPREIIEQANVYYWDRETEHWIASGRRLYEGREREFAVAFDWQADVIEVVSILPLKKGQKANRIQAGRWIELESEGSSQL